MSHFISFSEQIKLIVFVSSDFKFYIFNNFETVTYKSNPFFRIVGHETHFGDVQVS